LNEANSDIMGATAEAWLASGGGKGGNPATINITDKTWKIGEDVAGIIFPGGALRFMNDPTKDMASKDNYAERLLPGSMDNGGVHLNSGIANLFYYLLVSGGSHPRMKTPGVVVRGIGINKAAHIFELANTRFFTSMTDFQGARYGTARAAEILYGRCGEEWANVHRAWDAVGVPGAWSPCVKPPSSF
jgi:vibriolysin